MPINKLRMLFVWAHSHTPSRRRGLGFSHAGFTLTEILVGISIIAILTGIFVAGFPKGREDLTLQGETHKLIQDLREIQGMALSAKEEKVCPGGEDPCGFGAYFNQFSSEFYLLFAECDTCDDPRPVYAYSEGDKVLKSINFERKVRICNLYPRDFVSVIFVPPSPKTYINGSEAYPYAQIILWWEEENLNCLESPDTKRKVIEVNKAGLIEIAD